MWWLMTLAMASPVWTNGSAVIYQGLRAPNLVIDTPSGSWLYRDDYSGVSMEAWNAGELTPIATTLPASGRPILSGPCDVDGDGDEDVLFQGTFAAPAFHDARGPVVLALETTPLNMLSTFTELICVDLDGDGHQEFLGRTTTDLLHTWDHLGFEAAVDPLGSSTLERMAVGQLDDDPSLELALTDGRVMQLDTWTVEATLPPTISSVQFYDVDGNGIDEMWAATPTGYVLWDMTTGVRWRLARWKGASRIDDFDGDGTVEIVVAARPYLWSDPWTIHGVFDAATGRRRGPPQQGLTCDAWHRFDHDGDGRGTAMCIGGRHAAQQLDVSTTRKVLMEGYAPYAVSPIAGDLDGDGVEEVLWTSTDERVDRIVLRDAQGEWLDVLPTVGPPAVALYDLDGDGDQEVLFNEHWLDWSPSTGFVRVRDSPLRTGTCTIVRSIADLDQDGYPEILMHPCGVISPFEMLDTRTGARTVHPTGFEDGLEAADVDGDGDEEWLTTSGFVHKDGTVTPLPFGLNPIRVMNLPGARLAVVRRAGIEIYALPSVQSLESEPLVGVNSVARTLMGGRIWYHDSVALHGYSPIDRSTVDLPSYSPHYMEVADGVLWSIEGDELHGIELP